MNEIYFLRKRTVNALYSILDFFPGKTLAANCVLKNKHRGERCFILGSGHSIMTQDLTLLANDIVMTQNHFHAHKDIAAINPLYHVVVPKFHPKSFDKDWIDWLKGMEEKLPARTMFFFSTGTKKMVEETTGLGARSYYVKCGYHAVCLSRAKVDITRRLMDVPTVITECIAIALYMGFGRIYLVGFDLDQIFQFSKGRDNVRFYGHSPITQNEAEKKLEEGFASNGMHFFNYWRLWRQLNLLKEYAENSGQEIVNLTNGGILNVFRRENYEEVARSA